MCRPVDRHTALKSFFSTSHPHIFAAHQVNFLAPVMLAYYLMPGLLKSDAARIINVASAIHKNGKVSLGNINLNFHWSASRAYASSKLLKV